MQTPVESLGLARRELAEEAMLEAEQVWMAVLMLEVEVELMVKKAPPSSSYPIQGETVEQ